jgi:hypothetical protein
VKHEFSPSDVVPTCRDPEDSIMPNGARPTTGTQPPHAANDWGPPGDRNGRLPTGTFRALSDSSHDPHIRADEPPDRNDLEDEDTLLVGSDDTPWEAFIPDDDELDPEPEDGDFWIDDELNGDWSLEIC